MDIEIQSDLEENDREYTEGLIPFSNVVNYILDIPPTIYNPAQIQPKIIINYLKNYKVIKDMNVCSKLTISNSKFRHVTQYRNLRRELWIMSDGYIRQNVNM